MSYLLSIVLPCYNPPTGWEEEILGFYNELKGIWDVNDIQIIIVNDGSTKGISPQTLEHLNQSISNFTYFSYHLNRGKGFALRKGMKQAQGNLIVYTDIDIPYTFGSFKRIVEGLNEFEIAVGVRNNSYYTKIPKVRLFISKILKRFIKLFFKLKTYDTQGGLKGMRKEMKDLFLDCKTDRYLFDLEFIYLASKRNKNLAAIDVNLKDGIVMRKMNWKIIFQELWSLVKLYFGKK